MSDDVARLKAQLGWVFREEFEAARNRLRAEASHACGPEFDQRRKALVHAVMELNALEDRALAVLRGAPTLLGSPDGRVRGQHRVQP